MVQVSLNDQIECNWKLHWSAMQKILLIHLGIFVLLHVSKLHAQLAHLFLPSVSSPTQVSSEPTPSSGTVITGVAVALAA